MEHNSDEDTDISESKISDYEDKSYQKLKNGSHCVKTSDETFTCPYCPKKRKQDYMYKGLLQHASGCTFLSLLMHIARCLIIWPCGWPAVLGHDANALSLACVVMFGQLAGAIWPTVLV
ncbi:unnamed protein product [Lupinus luteus]|uniref:Zinc finger-XS domain-containing protein n=1 Tax=Lupinus luteus TaxID=3873 RepID=A0AAV1WMX7_LUPLU